MTDDQLLEYLEIAAKFRHQEFNTQTLRMVVFTGAQAVLIASYTASIDHSIYSPLMIAIFGEILSILWFIYYRASRYWIWFWELRAKEINDEFVKQTHSKVNLFVGHPAGAHSKARPFIFGGRKVKHGNVHGIISLTLALVAFLWLALIISYIIKNAR